VDFKPSDIILVHGANALGSAIRIAERGPGEPPAYANHVAGFTSATDVTEALWSVQTTPYESWHVTTPIFQIWRCNAITDEQRSIVANVAQGYVGRSYGWWKLLLHLGDSALSWYAGREIYAFRRCMADGRYPICSWVWAYAYEALAPNFFGIAPSEAQPDDIGDWLNSHQDVWAKIYESTGEAI
jgi:hypothetical protein